MDFQTVTFFKLALGSDCVELCFWTVEFKPFIRPQQKILNVGNFSPIVTEEDLYELSGFKTTSYLQKTCKAKLFLCLKTGNSRCFVYVLVLQNFWKQFQYNNVKATNQPSTTSVTISVASSTTSTSFTIITPARTLSLKSICYASKGATKTKPSRTANRKQKKVSKTSQENVSLLTVPGEPVL